MSSRTWVISIALCLLSASAQAQLGNAFTYQGRLEDGGQPKNGTVDLRFDAFNLLASGTTVNATPVILDAVPLSNGVFTVQVDFGNGVFLGDSIFLEIGVREDAAGVAGDPNGFTTLAPRQSVTPAPYAIHADNVSLDAIGSAQVLDGTLTASDANTTSTSQGLQRRLTSSCPLGQVLRDIGNDGAPTCVSVGDITSVTTATGSGLNGGNGFGDIALSIDSNETQARIAGTCERGRAALNRVNNNGSVDCSYYDVATPVAPVVLDSVGDVGSHLSIRREGLFSSNPAVAYYDATNQRLKFVSCNSFACGTVNPPVILDDPANNVGQFPSLMAIGSRIMVAYHDVTARDLKLAICSDENCTGPTAIVVLDSAGDVGRSAAIMDVGGLAAVAYFDASNNRYKYVRCNDIVCTAPVARALTGLGGGGTLISAVTSVRDQTLSLPEFTIIRDGSELVLVRCADVDCTAFTTVVVSDNTDVGPPIAMLRASIGGNVHRWFSLSRPSGGNFRFRFCLTEACTGIVGVTGTAADNPTFSALMLRLTRTPMFLFTRVGDSLVSALPFSSATLSLNINTLTGSITAQGAFDVMQTAVGPAIVFYEGGAQNLVFLRCGRDDCTDL